MVPDWPIVTLADVLKTIIDYRGKTPPKAQMGIPVLTAASVKAGRVLKNKISYISQNTYDEVTTRGYPKKGDVLITTEAPFGEVAPFPTDQVYHITRRIMALRGNPNLINSDYLLYVLMGSDCQDQLESRTRGTTVPRVLKTDITGLTFKLPPLLDQNKIGLLLSSIDRKIELNSQINQTLETITKALFKSWFVDFDPVIDNAQAAGNEIPEPFSQRLATRQALKDKVSASDRSHSALPEEIRLLFPSTFQFTEELGWIPEGWSVGVLSDLADITMGQSPPGNTYNDNGEGLPFYQGSTDFGFRFPSIRKYCSAPKRLAKKDDVLLSVRAPVGDLNRALDECCIGRGLASIRSMNNHSSWVFYRCSFFKEQFDTFNSEGTVFGSVNGKDLKSINTCVSPKSVFDAFEDMVKPMDESIRVKSEEIICLTKIRDLLLPKLISGELRIPDVEKLVVEAGL